MNTTDDKNVLALVDLIEGFLALKRKRDEFIRGLGDDLATSRVLGLAMEAGEEIFNREIIPGGPGLDVARQDVKTYRGKAVEATVQIAEEILRSAATPHPNHPQWPWRLQMPPPPHRLNVAQEMRGVTRSSSAARH